MEELTKDMKYYNYYRQAGDVVGYLGRTGYSRTENTNNIDETHLHFGLELVFDESQKESNNKLRVSCYDW